MKRALLAALLLLLIPGSVLSDSDLTQAVNAAFIPRTEDPALHELAHQRALEASVDFSHTGMVTAEVLAWNQGFSDPITHVLSQWVNSPAHAALLSEPAFTSIGCGAVTTSDGRYVAACLLSRAAPAQSAEPVVAARSPKPTPAGSTPASGAISPPIVVLPDAAMRTPDGISD